MTARSKRFLRISHLLCALSEFVVVLRRFNEYNGFDILEGEHLGVCVLYSDFLDPFWWGTVIKAATGTSMIVRALETQ
jgi:hypothetical protein